MCILVFSGNLYRLQLFQMEDPLFNVTLSWHHEEKTLICVTEWGRKQTQTLDSWGKNCEFIHSETQISKIYTVPLSLWLPWDSPESHTMRVSVKWCKAVPNNPSSDLWLQHPFSPRAPDPWLHPSEWMLSYGSLPTQDTDICPQEASTLVGYNNTVKYGHSNEG